MVNDSIPLNQTPIDALILDLDGTLVDTLGDFSAALNLMLEELALPAIASGQILTMVGKGTEHLLRSALAAVLAPEGEVSDGTAPQARRVESLYPEALASYQRHYPQINGRHSQVYEGVAEGLAALQALGLPMACVTNKPLGFARPLLEAKGLAGYFRAVFGGDSFERKKPDPLPLIKTCEALGTLPGRTLMVGDSSNDARAAAAAGCPVALLGYGYNHGQPICTVRADAYLDSLAELPPMLSLG
ncbi:MAG: phosphoglycolate phosphatase [Curvibacter sp.]|nr:phosphoglycolate phosphatase [Curvibacter sp.]